MDIFKQHIVTLLRKSTQLNENDISTLLESPSNPGFGDYSFPCFLLAQQLKKNPAEVANNLSKYFFKDEYVSRVECKGAYVNFFINQSKLNEITIKEILKMKERYGSINIKGKKALVEHTSINPNAEPHVGRARNALIGDAIVRLIKFNGYKTETHYYINDIGKQIAMLVLAANNKKPKFHDLIKLYVEINKKLEQDPKIEDKVFELLNKLEKGNRKIKKQFNDIVEICIKGQKEIFEELNIKYDHFDYESKYLFNKDCENLLKELAKTKKLFTDNENRQVLDLREYLPEDSAFFVLTRNDGTSLYGLRDLAYTIYKINKAKDKNIVVLGEDQKLYFTQLKAALKLLNYKSPEIVHYSFVLLQEGKMSTRKGNVILLSEFMNEAVKKAQNELDKRKNNDKKLAKIIGYGALKYSILKNAPEKNVFFDWDQALSFEGESSPYIQYSYARANSILKKVKFEKKFNFNLLNKKEEITLIKLMHDFPNVVNKALRDLKPNYIANYSYELAQKFNEFYHNCPVIKERKELRNTRLALVLAFTHVIKTSLNLIGIEAPEKM
ncbi:MAG: arginine--tRNA ligase [Nanoarchaeota archaeon]